MKNLIYAILVMAGLMCFSCNQSDTTHSEGRTSTMINEVDEFVDHHTAENSLDYYGIYEGTLPCASCEGIETTIILNEDHSYNITSRYLGKDESEFEESGNFVIQGSTLTFEEKDAPNKCFVGEGYLQLLDQQGNKVTGSLAEHYVLNKIL